MMEIRRDLYMDEYTGIASVDGLEALSAHLADLVDAISAASQETELHQTSQRTSRVRSPHPSGPQPPLQDDGAITVIRRHRDRGLRYGLDRRIPCVNPEDSSSHRGISGAFGRREGATTPLDGHHDSSKHVALQ